MGKELILQKGFFATSGFCSPLSFSTSASCGHHHLGSFSPLPPPLKHGLYHVVCSNSFLIAFLPTVSFPLWSIFYTAISIFFYIKCVTALFKNLLFSFFTLITELLGKVWAIPHSTRLSWINFFFVKQNKTKWNIHYLHCIYLHLFSLLFLYLSINYYSYF